MAGIVKLLCSKLQSGFWPGFVKYLSKYLSVKRHSLDPSRWKVLLKNIHLLILLIWYIFFKVGTYTTRFYNEKWPWEKKIMQCEDKSFWIRLNWNLQIHHQPLFLLHCLWWKLKALLGVGLPETKTSMHFSFQL